MVRHRSLFLITALCTLLVITSSLVTLLTMPIRWPFSHPDFFRRPSMDGGLDKRERLVIRDAATWRATWSRLNRGEAAGPAPPIDFQRNAIIVVATGPTSNSGYGVEVRDVSVREGQLVIDVADHEPGDGCATLPVITFSTDVVIVPAFTGPAVFVEHRTSTPCR